MTETPPGVDPIYARNVIDAVHKAIRDVSRVEERGMAIIHFDEVLSALAYLIAAIGVQTKAADTPIKAKAFTKAMRFAIQKNIETFNKAGDPEPFEVGATVFPTGDRH
jgi:hypothetical protein